MVKNKQGDVLMMTRDEMYAENAKVIHAWGKSYLNFNLAHFVELANQQHFRLWKAMIEIDCKKSVGSKVNGMHKLLSFLLNK